MKPDVERSDRLTAFRLPAKLLAEVDSVRELLDITRSQLFRRSVTEFIERHGKLPCDRSR